MNKKLSFICALLAFTVLLPACKDDEPDIPTPSANCTNVNVSFATDIMPIITTSCAVATCHVIGGFGPGDYTLGFAPLKTVADNGKLRTEVVVSKDMPITGGTSPITTGLSQAQIDLFDCWIADGALDN